MKKLSERQERILNFVRHFLEEQGYPPTVRDIQRACDISSTSVVDYNLQILQREGHIRRSPEVSRGLELLDASGNRAGPLRVPVLGYIAAGEPLPSFSGEEWSREEPLEWMDISSSLLRGQREVYALRVRGMSMIDALITDGDLVVIHPSHDVRNGDTVVAWLKPSKEATLKRFYREGNRVRLQPANNQMEAIVVSARDLEVQGKVIAVVRDLS